MSACCGSGSIRSISIAGASPAAARCSIRSNCAEKGCTSSGRGTSCIIYNLRLQSNAQTYNAISKEGVSVTAQINMRYQLLNNSVARAAQVHRARLSEIGHQSGNRQPGAAGHLPIHRSGGLYLPRSDPGENPRRRAKGLGANLNKLVQPEAMEQPDPEDYND